MPTKATSLYEEISILHEPQSLPPLFTKHDMRLMSHFIVDAHPHLPLDHDAVWSREMPAFAQEVSYISPVSAILLYDLLEFQQNA